MPLVMISLELHASTLSVKRDEKTCFTTKLSDPPTWTQLGMVEQHIVKLLLATGERSLQLAENTDPLDVSIDMALMTVSLNGVSFTTALMDMAKKNVPSPLEDVSLLRHEYERMLAGHDSIEAVPDIESRRRHIEEEEQNSEGLRPPTQTEAQIAADRIMELRKRARR